MKHIYLLSLFIIAFSLSSCMTEDKQDLSDNWRIGYRDNQACSSVSCHTSSGAKLLLRTPPMRRSITTSIEAGPMDSIS